MAYGTCSPPRSLKRLPGPHGRSPGPPQAAWCRRAFCPLSHAGMRCEQSSIPNTALGGALLFFLPLWVVFFFRGISLINKSPQRLNSVHIEARSRLGICYHRLTVIPGSPTGSVSGLCHRTHTRLGTRHEGGGRRRGDARKENLINKVPSKDLNTQNNIFHGQNFVSAGRKWS